MPFSLLVAIAKYMRMVAISMLGSKVIESQNQGTQ
jgi:hypothetical protein